MNICKGKAITHTYVVIYQLISDDDGDLPDFEHIILPPALLQLPLHVDGTQPGSQPDEDLHFKRVSTARCMDNSTE